MIFNEWLSLSDEERAAEKTKWHVFEPGYWHTMANEAAVRFAAEFGSTPGVERICKSLYQSDDLIVAVQTNAAATGMEVLPKNYLGFRVVQFSGKPLEGVLVDVSPPNAARA